MTFWAAAILNNHRAVYSRRKLRFQVQIHAQFCMKIIAHNTGAKMDLALRLTTWLTTNQRRSTTAEVMARSRDCLTQTLTSLRGRFLAVMTDRSYGINIKEAKMRTSPYPPNARLHALSKRPTNEIGRDMMKKMKNFRVRTMNTPIRARFQNAINARLKNLRKTKITRSQPTHIAAIATMGSRSTSTWRVSTKTAFRPKKCMGRNLNCKTSYKWCTGTWCRTWTPCNSVCRSMVPILTLRRLTNFKTS